MNNNNMKIILETTHFAALKHKDQRRKDPEGTPYINHPIGVANLLVEAGVEDVSVLQAALLHDTVEDTDTTHEELVQKFGEKVANIVKEVTDDKSLAKQERKAMQIVKAPKSSTGAKLVKLADKIYNCGDLARQLPVGWSEERRKEYFQWSLAVVDAGLRGVNQQLEENFDALIKNNLVI